jgi:hypothetical protein
MLDLTAIDLQLSSLAFRWRDDFMVDQNNLIVAQNLHKFFMNFPHRCHHRCTNRCHVGLRGIRQCTVVLLASKGSSVKETWQQEDKK